MKVNLYNDLSFRNTIKKSSSSAVNVSFRNFSSKEVIPPADSCFLNEKYYYDLEEAVIIGNRSCLQDQHLYMDLPVEWSAGQVISYIDRVRSIHKGKEFSFLSDIDLDDGTAYVDSGRPYMRVNKPCVFVGCVEAWNFGFFVSVILFKIHIANQVAPGLPVLLPITRQWQVNLLDYVFPDKEFIFYDPRHSIEVSKVKIIGWPNFPFYMDEDYLGVYKSRLNFESSFFPSRKIYFSRNKFNGGKDRVNFSPEAEAILLKKGYMPVFPEEMSYRVLHSVLSSCTHVAMESGSALFNGVFLSPDTDVFLLESREGFLSNHSKFLSSITGRGQVLFCDNESVLEAVNFID